MKFDTPAGTNPIDRERVVGQPHERIDGRLKVTGTAPYAYEHHDIAENVAYGYVVGSAIAKGRITRLDSDGRPPRAGRRRDRHPRERRRTRQGRQEHARLLGGPRCSTITKRSRSSLPTPSSRPAPRP